MRYSAPMICCVLLLVGGLASAQQQQPFRVPEGITLKSDMVFAQVGDRELHMDIAYQTEAPQAPRPCVVYIHGGAWCAGTYHAPAQLCNLARQGYIAASIEYRLTQEAIFPAQIHDCKGALRFLRAHAAEYGLKPDKIGVWGGSAGGHLVALIGTSGGVKELEGEVGGNLDQSSAVQCVVDFFGPSDMTTVVSDRGRQLMPINGLGPEEALVGGKIEEHLEVAKAASPVTYVDRTDPPFLICHGDQDNVVPLVKSVKLDKALRDAGVETTMVIVKGAGHGFDEQCDPPFSQILLQVGDFLARALKR